MPSLLAKPPSMVFVSTLGWVLTMLPYVLGYSCCFYSIRVSCLSPDCSCALLVL
jgi:hypothetical protein